MIYQIMNTKKKLSNQKIKIVGIPTPLRYLTSNYKIDVVGNLEDAIKKSNRKLDLLKLR